MGRSPGGAPNSGRVVSDELIRVRTEMLDADQAYLWRSMELLWESLWLLNESVTHAEGLVDA